jgi:hypothetical protein
MACPSGMESELSECDTPDVAPRYSAEMRFRALMEQSPWVRGACLVLLLVFLLVCGIHLAGIHHGADSDALGLVDRLATTLLLAVLGFALTALSRRRTEGPSDARSAQDEILLATAFEASHFRLVTPLRC